MSRAPLVWTAGRTRLAALCAGALMFLGATHAASQKKVVTDFEDFGTWRLKESKGVKVRAWWPVETGLAGSDAARDRDSLVGELKFAFDPQQPGPYTVGFERAKMSQTSGFLDGIEWDANANGLPVSLRFQILDSANKVFFTKPVPLSGTGWQHYRVDLNPETLPGFAECKFPARLKRVTLQAETACEGSVYLDDLTLTGRFAKKDRLSITPIYEGILTRPGDATTLRYRLRSTQPEVTTGTLTLEVKDFNGKKILAKEQPFSASADKPGELSFPLGTLPLGAYEVALTAKTDGQDFPEQDHFVVMDPNNGRPNKHPMWFGVGDGSGWQGDLENRRHWEWMKLLGADINRMELFSERFEPQEGVVNDAGWRKLIQGHADAGVDIMVLYASTPRWTHKNWQYRHPPDLPDKFEAHAAHLAAFLKQFPNVTYLEFWNEPDLDFFGGTLDEYVDMFQHFSKGFRSVYPELPFTSGGVTVEHPREKKGFSQGMYERTASLYQVAAYHSHGPLINTEVRQKQVDEWLKAAGLQDRRIFNTETGDRSLYNPEGRRRQAITLVKKVIYSKAQPTFDAYFWFTLQDYWDMDPEADDSFGLITSDNRAKPSFAAYNTLIRELANTKPAPEQLAVKDLSLFAFVRDDGRYVYAGWPVETRSNAVLWIKTPQKLQVSDMFGRTREYAPLGDILPIPIGELPLYISGATPGEPIRLCPPGEEFLRLDGEVRFANPNAPVAIPVVFKNPTTAPLQVTLALRGGEGRELAVQKVEAAPGQEVSWSPQVIPSQVSKDGALQLEITLAGSNAPAFTFPVRLIENYSIQKVAALNKDTALWPSLNNVPALTLDRADQVVELAYDPNTPAWKGPADLSAKARLVHDGQGIRFQIAVTDDVPGPAQAKDQMWRGDDIQLAFGNGKTKKFPVLDLGQSLDGPAVWCSEHDDPSRIGEWQAPLKVTKAGNTTTYDVYLPFEKLGFSPDDKDIRFSFLVNENEGKGRIRWIEWTPGIARDRSLESLGHGRLE